MAATDLIQSEEVMPSFIFDFRFSVLTKLHWIVCEWFRLAGFIVGQSLQLNLNIDRVLNAGVPVSRCLEYNRILKTIINLHLKVNNTYK